MMRGIVGLLRLAVVLIGGGIVVAFTLAALAPRVADIFSANTSSAAEVNLDQLALRSIVYDAAGEEFDVLFDVENRALVELGDVSDELLTTVLVVEDEGFYDHNGVDAAAIIRALIHNVQAGGEIEQGGSTITQQLIKNGVIGNDLEVDRKLTEAAFAIRLERQLTKEEILTAYLNTVYFGGGAYGIRAAAEIYFGITPDRLDWGQSAMLAGLIASPADYDPTRHPDAARDRRATALGRLVVTDNITEEQAAHYRDRPVPSSRFIAAKWEPTNYFIEEVRRQLLDDPRMGATRSERAEALFGGGLRIHTTYDPAAQAAAEAAIERFRPDDERFFVAALAAVEPGTGKVRAIVGGPGFDQLEFNIATQKGRPTGSAFKVFVLAAAMEKGFVPADQLNGAGGCEFDNPGGFPNPYRAVNFGGSGGSVSSIRSQTLRSSNCAYLRLGQIVGLSNVADTARALGITTDLSDLPISMPLGPKDVTPIDMATAFASFANDGVQVDPIFIDRVEDRDGNIILENFPRGDRAISEQSARLVTRILEANVRGGTGTAARLGDQPAAGKTGTAQDFTNAWFVGFTPHLATAVWMGNPHEQVGMRGVNRPEMGVGSITGGSLPARIWAAFNIEYHADLAVESFAAPGPTRPGIRIRTDFEEDEYLELIDSFCGDEDAEIDTDEDGTTDFCEDSDFLFDPGIGECPTLFEPVDDDHDGEVDGCMPPTTTTTTTTTTSTTTTSPPGTTTTTTTIPPDE